LKNLREDETGERDRERHDDDRIDPGGWMVNHRCKKCFYYFYKNAFFNVFYFLERFFLFSSSKIFCPIKPAKMHKTTLK